MMPEVTPAHLKAHEHEFLTFDTTEELCDAFKLGAIVESHPTGNAFNQGEKITAAKGVYAIRQYHKSKPDPAHFAGWILRECAYVRRLNQDGIATPLMLNEYPVLLNGVLTVVTAFVEGEPLDPAKPDDVQEALALVARMHTLSLQYGTLGYAPELRTDYRQEIKAHDSELSSLVDLQVWSQTFQQAIEQELLLYKLVPTALIHTELNPHHFIRTEGTLYVVDFKQLRHAPLIHDLNRLLEAWCTEPDGSFNWQRARDILTAYNQGRALTPEEKQHLADDWLYSLLAKIGYSLVASLDQTSEGEKFRTLIVPRRVAQWKAFPEFKTQLAQITSSLP